ncbi:MAG: DoxX family protein [Candidatus Paceibacterota bacterium]|jgi:putative oxidoreductase
MIQLLSVFPSFLTYGLVAPLILRLVLGGIFLSAGYLKIFKHRESTISMFKSANFPKPLFFMWLVAYTELICGFFLILGLWTQVSALLIAIISLGGLIIKLRKPSLLRQTTDFYIFALAIAISLLFSGAGFFSIDLPL